MFSLVPRLSVGGGKRVRVTAYQEPGYEASMCHYQQTNTLKQETGFSLSLYWRGLNHLINITVGCGLTFAEEFEVSY